MVGGEGEGAKRGTRLITYIGTYVRRACVVSEITFTAMGV